jgi:hypothetical protein
MKTTKAAPAGVFEVPAKKKLKVHPLAARFPMLDQETLDDMKRSIGRDGQHQPGVLDEDDQLLDGRMRKSACDELGKSFLCIRREFADEDSKQRFILSINKDRRQFNHDQSAALIIDLYYEAFELEGKQAMIEGGAKGGKAKGKGSGDSPEASDGKRQVKFPTTRERLRLELGVSDHRSKISIKLFKEAHDLLEDVINGRLTLNQAAKALAKRNTPPKQKKQGTAFGGNGPKRGHQIVSALSPEEIETVHGWVAELAAQVTGEFEDADARVEAWEIIEADVREELKAFNPPQDGQQEQE